MKQFFTLILSFFFVASSFAQTNTVITNGKWDNASIWSLKRVPANGDKVEIPTGKTVLIDYNEDLSASNIEVSIFGTLQLNNGKLSLGRNSKIVIFEAAKLVTLKNNPSDKITIGGVEKYNGSLGTLNGYLIANSTTSVSPNGFMKSTPIILPVKFASFDVVIKNGSVQVQWATAEEANADYFEIERSFGNNAWTVAGRVKAAGNSTQIINYSFTDKTPVSGTVYYRIKQADIDGKAVYTTIKSVTGHAGSQVNITAVNSQVAVQFIQQLKGKVSVLIVNRAGQVVAQQNLESPVGNVMVNTASLKGNHFVTIQSAAGVNASKQVVL